jgi:hypothetical protein
VSRKQSGRARVRHAPCCKRRFARFVTTVAGTFLNPWGLLAARKALAMRPLAPTRPHAGPKNAAKESLPLGEADLPSPTLCPIVVWTKSLSLSKAKGQKRTDRQEKTVREL